MPRAQRVCTVKVVGNILQGLVQSVRQAHTKKAKDRRPALTVNVARERICWKTQAQRAVVAWNALGVRPARTVRNVVA